MACWLCLVAGVLYSTNVMLRGQSESAAGADGWEGSRWSTLMHHIPLCIASSPVQWHREAEGLVLQAWRWRNARAQLPGCLAGTKQAGSSQTLQVETLMHPAFSAWMLSFISEPAPRWQSRKRPTSGPRDALRPADLSPSCSDTQVQVGWGQQTVPTPLPPLG